MKIREAFICTFGMTAAGIMSLTIVGIVIQVDVPDMLIILAIIFTLVFVALFVGFYRIEEEKPKCPECGSKLQYWKPISDKDIDTWYCKKCPNLFKRKGETLT